ncbi:hypothetical protein [Lyticum sinuosum]|uniref:Uncharacterized protein n=1 Tax=Lyticum sinuosum TaxID=1332059 RepID=A0AAE4VLJ6_9RICK|nr:hypothetical protein [Lyticum sinuosum]MDZ5760858.1 hypothetical protein [Lyticum sinuosum]
MEYTSDSFNDNSKVTKVSVFSTCDDPKSTNKGYIELEVEGAGTFKNYVPEDKSFQVIKPGQQVTLYLDGDINSNKKVSIYFGESIDLGNKEIYIKNYYY